MLSANRLVVVRITLGIVLVLTSFGTVVAQETASDQEASRFNELVERASEDGEIRVIVQLTSIGAQEQVIQLVTELDGHVNTRYELFPLLAMSVGPEAVTALAQSHLVVNVNEDIPQPPALNTTLPVINADQVHDLGWTGAGYTVAILDTGIDAGHPFFAGRIVEEACYSTTAGLATTLCPDGSQSQTGAGSADATTANCVNAAGNNICDHGTHVAGIAAGAVSGAAGEPGDGVAPDATIIAIQVFSRIDDDPPNDNTPCADNNRPSPCVLTFADDQISGLQRVLVLSGTYDIAAANMSLGGGQFAATCDGDGRKPAIDALLAANIATVVSAMNNGFLNAVGAPSCISTAIAVGSTDDDDTVSGFSNRGPLLDLFAPGNNVNSAVIEAGNNFNTKNGTSMAAPHVAGAFAVLLEAYPTANIATLLSYMVDTGVPITYSTGNGGMQTTPRLNLLAALQEGNEPPVLTVDNNPVTVDEGDTATNTGTFSDPDGDPVTLSASIGTVVDAGGGNWSWSFETRDGPDESQTVTVFGTDDKGETGSVIFELIVENVDPTVTIVSVTPATTIDEGDSITIVAEYTDPGWVDTHTAVIDWGHPDLTSPAVLVADPVGPPLASGTVTGTQIFGDRGSFTVVVRVTDKDGGVGEDSVTINVNNVDPTAEIDLTDAIDVNGVPTFLAEAGEPVEFTGRATDPGSDDLTLHWDWDDGTTDETLYLVNPPNPDPFPSPSNQPKDITEVIEHTFAEACFYLIGFWAEDDDGGVSDVDEASVIIVGNADQSRSVGYWLHQYRGNGRIDFNEDQLMCFLAIARHMSAVFDEERPLTTLEDSFNVLFVGGSGGDMLKLLDRQILAAWLNFANGAIGYDQMVDTTGNGVPDTLFSAVMTNAENVRLDPTSTRAQQEAQKNILERINGS